MQELESKDEMRNINAMKSLSEMVKRIEESEPQKR